MTNRRDFRKPEKKFCHIFDPQDRLLNFLWPQHPRFLDQAHVPPKMSEWNERTSS